MYVDSCSFHTPCLYIIVFHIYTPLPKNIHRRNVGQLRGITVINYETIINYTIDKSINQSSSLAATVDKRAPVRAYAVHTARQLSGVRRPLMMQKKSFPPCTARMTMSSTINCKYTQTVTIRTHECTMHDILIALSNCIL
jgi:hypothetical protein